MLLAGTKITAFWHKIITDPLTSSSINLGFKRRINFKTFFFFYSLVFNVPKSHITIESTKHDHIFSQKKILKTVLE